MTGRDTLPRAVVDGRYMAVRAADRAAPDLIVNTVGRCTVAVSPSDVSHEVAGALNLAACWTDEARRLRDQLTLPERGLLDMLGDMAEDSHSAGWVAELPATMAKVLASWADYNAGDEDAPDDDAGTLPTEHELRNTLDALQAAGWIAPWAEREGDEVELTLLARTLRWNA